MLEILTFLLIVVGGLFIWWINDLWAPDGRSDDSVL